MKKSFPKREDVLVLVAYFIIVLGLIFILYMDRKGEGGGGRLRPKETAIALSPTPSPVPTYTSLPTSIPIITSEGWRPEVPPREIDLIARTLACESYYDVWEVLVCEEVRRSEEEEPGELDCLVLLEDRSHDTIAVAWVIRTLKELKGKSYIDVINEPGRFSCWPDGDLPEKLVRKRDEFCEYLPLEQCYWFLEVAIGVVNGWLNNPMPGATHFYSRCYYEEHGLEPPSWTKDGVLVGCTECHCFYKLVMGGDA